MGTVPDADKLPEVWRPDTQSFVTFKNINFMGQISEILIIVSTFLEIVIKLITVLHWSRVREGGDWCFHTQKKSDVSQNQPLL